MCESTATSAASTAGSAVRSDVNSPDLIKPKYPKQQAAQTMVASYEHDVTCGRADCSCPIMAGVIGSRRGGSWGWRRAIPFRTYCKRGQSTLWGGLETC